METRHWPGSGPNSGWRIEAVHECDAEPGCREAPPIALNGLYVPAKCAHFADEAENAL